MLEKLKKKTELLLEENKDNIDEYKKYLIIKKILEKPDCFLSMSIEYSYAILRDLGISNENLRSTYMELISFNEDSEYSENPFVKK